MDLWTTPPSIVLMPVPLHLAQRVADFIDKAEAQKADARTVNTHDESNPTTATGVLVDDDNGIWTPSMTSRIREELPYPGVRALIDRCSDRPGEWIAKLDVEREADVSSVQLRNELVAFSKLTKRLFGYGTWPVRAKRELGAFHYMIDPTIASWWRNGVNAATGNA